MYFYIFICIVIIKFGESCSLDLGVTLVWKGSWFKLLEGAWLNKDPGAHLLSGRKRNETQ